MALSTRVLKRPALPEGHAAPQPARYPVFRHVEQEAPSEAQPEFRQRGLIRRETARLTATPLEVSAPDFGPPSGPRLALPEPEPVPLLPGPEPDAAALREAWEAEWADRLAREVEAARAEGYARGRADAGAEHQLALQEARNFFAGGLDSLRDSWEHRIRETEPLLIELALRFAEQVLDAPLSPELARRSTDLLVSAVDQLAGESTVNVSVHPVDLLRLEEAGFASQAMSTPPVRWHSDPALRQGEWIVAAPHAMIRRITAEMIQSLKEQLDLAPDPEA